MKMKKIIVVLASIAMATCVEAGTFKWGSAANGAVYQAGGGAVLAEASVYLFDTSAYTQAALFDAFAGTGVDYSKALGSTTTASTGKFTAVTTDATEGQAYNIYLAIVDGDNLYLSDVKSYTGPAVGKSTTVNYALTANTKAAVKEIESGSAISGQGWYTAVPEPTSGLLLLLGMAGLALKRKRV
jgi:hypothetical protein